MFNKVIVEKETTFDGYEGNLNIAMYLDNKCVSVWKRYLGSTFDVIEKELEDTGFELIWTESEGTYKKSLWKKIE